MKEKTKKNKGFIPIIFIIIGAVVLASATFGVVKYKDEITANVSKIFNKSPKLEIIAPDIDSTEKDEAMEETELVEEPVVEETELIKEPIIEEPKKDDTRQLQEQLRIAEQKRLEAEKQLAEEKARQEEQKRLEVEGKQREELLHQQEVYIKTLMQIDSLIIEGFQFTKKQANDIEPLLEDRIEWLRGRIEFTNSAIKEMESWNTQSSLSKTMIDFHKDLNELYAIGIKIVKIYQWELNGYKSVIQKLIDGQNDHSSTLSKIDLSEITERLTKAEFTEIANKQIKQGNSTISKEEEVLIGFLKKYRDYAEKTNQEYLDVIALAKGFVAEFETEEENSNYQPNYYIPPIPQITFFRDSALLDISESLNNISQQLQQMSPQPSPW